MKRIDMILWGELLPETQTGISISNSGIIDILQKNNKKIITIEEISWNKSPLYKILYIFSVFFKILKAYSKFKNRYFYFNIPLSKLGLIKLLLILPFFKLIRPSVCFTGHLHRGDLLFFVNSSKLNRLFIKFSLKFVDRVIVLSPLFAEQLKNIGFRKEIIFLRNTSSIEQENVQLKKEYCRKFICVANYIESKGLLDIINCFASKEFQDFSLDTYGNVYEANTLQKMKERATPNITINNALKREDFSNTVLKYDALVLPSWNEGQPIILIEAMSLGIPVIASDVGDIRNMTGNEYPFLFISKDLDSIKNTLINFDKFANKNKFASYLIKRYFDIFSNNRYQIEVNSIFK